ncbi:TRAP transporter large permease subunit [Escherichia coli]|nr:TRAP transporter large permease subunit [Escherichia coli]
MNAGGLSKRIVDLPMKLVGHKPGGLGYVGVLAAMIMASLSGSAVADTAAVAALLVPMMQRQLPGQPGGGLILAALSRQLFPFHSVYYFRRFQRIIHQLFMAALPRHDDGRNADAYGGGRPVALIYPASKSNDAGNLALFVSGIWALFLPVIIIGGFRSGLFTLPKPGPLLSMRCLSPQLFTVK